MIDRRGVVKAGLGALVGASVLMRSRDAAADHHTGHAGHAGHAGHGPDARHAALSDALAGCLKAGNVCLPHCLELMGEGDKSLRACAEAVHQMLAVCEATSVVAVTDSRHRTALIKLCRDVCQDCKTACLEHADRHAACKACADACARTIEAADAAVAAA